MIQYRIKLTRSAENDLRDIKRYISDEFSAPMTAKKMIVEIKDAHRPGKLKAYSLGCFASMRGKAWPIGPLNVDLAAYSRVVLFSPVWAGNPPPAVFAFLEQLPTGKAVSVKMVSGSGKSRCKKRIETILKAKHCALESYKDFKN